MATRPNRNTQAKTEEKNEAAEDEPADEPNHLDIGDNLPALTIQNDKEEDNAFLGSKSVHLDVFALLVLDSQGGEIIANVEMVGFICRFIFSCFVLFFSLRLSVSVRSRRQSQN